MEMERVEASLARLAAGAVQDEARDRCQLSSGCCTRACSRRISRRCGSASRRTICSRWPTAWCWPPRATALDRVQFEMLEGMANHQRRALFELTQNMLLYAPACRQDDFINAIGYLIRRLDENTGPDNFLRHAFNIEVGSDDLATSWSSSSSKRSRRWRIVGERPATNAGSQESRAEGQESRAEKRVAGSDPRLCGSRAFRNEPDTDWSLPQNGDWARVDHRQLATALRRPARPTCRW